jgi:hypothetical protein
MVHELDLAGLGVEIVHGLVEMGPHRRYQVVEIDRQSLHGGVST